jgi:hypothetical protein
MVKPYLTVYASLWEKLIWSMKAGEPVYHKTLAKAREYALSKGYEGIRVSFGRKSLTTAKGHP